MIKWNLVILFVTLFPLAIMASDKPTPEVIREYLAVTNTKQTLEMSLGPMKKLLSDELSGAYQKLRVKYGTDEQDEIIKKKLSSISSFVDNQVSWEKVEPLVIIAYQKELTQKHLEESIIFYKSESGQAILKKVPNIFKHITEDMVPMQKDIQEYAATTLNSLVKELDASNEQKNN